MKTDKHNIHLDRSEISWAMEHLMLALLDVRESAERDRDCARASYALGMTDALEMCTLITRSSAERCRALVDAWVHHERGCAC